MNETIKALKIIYGAMTIGAVVFGLIVFLVCAVSSGSGSDPTAANVSAVKMLSLFVAATSVFTYLNAAMIFKKIVSSVKPGDQSDATFQKIRNAYIIRMAMLEGEAFLGLAVCLVAGVTGVLRSYPIYGLVSMPFIILVVFAVRTFPNQERISRITGQQSSGNFIR